MNKLWLTIFLTLVAGLCPAADISIGWLPSTDTDVAGYNLYYGTASSVYTNKVSVGEATSTTISGLVNGVTYYFAATTYDAAGVEAPFSSEVSYAVPLVEPGSPPVIENSMATNIISAGQAWTLSLNAAGFGALTYSLGAGAPPGIYVTTNGLLVWTPDISQASTTNVFSVSVTDSQTPAQTVAQTFTLIVQDYACLSLTGGEVLSKSSPGSLPLALYASVPITNFQARLSYPACLLTNLFFSSTNPLISSFGLISNAPGEVVINLSFNSSNAISGWQSLGTIGFNATAGYKTEAVAISAASLSAIKTDGTVITDIPSTSAQLMLVGQGMLLQAGVINGVRQLTVYGPIGANFTVQSSDSFTSPSGWVAVTPTITVTNLSQTLELSPDNSTARFYRTRTIQ